MIFNSMIGYKYIHVNKYGDSPRIATNDITQHNKA